MEIKLYQELQILIGPNRDKNSLGTQLRQRPWLLTNSPPKQTRHCSSHTAAIKTKMQIHPEQGPSPTQARHANQATAAHAQSFLSFYLDLLF